MRYLRRSAVWGSIVVVAGYAFELVTVEEVTMALLFWLVMAVCGKENSK
ncbi:hypothetical protein HCJ39_13205 [Listeria rocourtiae]|nr:hypothetical protein [Listeria rocourtiae]MBC1605672.1 hypothetical protein [Listeria rocourtiae]